MGGDGSGRKPDPLVQIRNQKIEAIKNNQSLPQGDPLIIPNYSGVTDFARKDKSTGSFSQDTIKANHIQELTANHKIQFDNPINVNYGIYFGPTSDVNLYRVGANNLKTDDNFYVIGTFNCDNNNVSTNGSGNLHAASFDADGDCTLGGTLNAGSVYSYYGGIDDFTCSTTALFQGSVNFNNYVIFNGNQLEFPLNGNPVYFGTFAMGASGYNAGFSIPSNVVMGINNSYPRIGFGGGTTYSYNAPESTMQIIYTETGLDLIRVDSTYGAGGDLLCLDSTGVLKTQGYKSSDGSAGITTTQGFKDDSGNNKTMTIKNGLITDIS